MAILLSVLSAALWGGGDFGGGVLARRHPALLVVAVAQAAALLALTVAVLVVGTTAGAGQWGPWGAAAGVVGCLSLVAYYAALATGTMGVVSPIAALGGIVPVVVGFAQGERPGATAIAGISLALLGTVLASGPELRGGAPVRPVLLAVLAGAGFGGYFALVSQGAQSNVLMTLWSQRMASTTVLVALTLLTLRGTARPVGLDWVRLAVVGLADAGANLAFAVASTMGYLSVTSVLGSLYPVTTILLARLVLAERLRLVQVAGIVAAFAGVVMVSQG